MDDNSVTSFIDRRLTRSFNKHLENEIDKNKFKRLKEKVLRKFPKVHNEHPMESSLYQMEQVMFY